MSQLNEVKLVFTVNEKGAPVIRVIHDKESDAIEQKLLGLFIKNVKSNNNNLTLDMVKEFSDGPIQYELKVLGT